MAFCWKHRRSFAAQRGETCAECRKETSEMVYLDTGTTGTVQSVELEGKKYIVMDNSTFWSS